MNSINFNNADFLQSFGVSSQLPPSTTDEIVFAGRSNVGKSSAINKIFNRKKLARVSATPGKTITINFYKVDNIHLVDLPGYGYAKVSKAEQDRFSRLIDNYLISGRQIKMLFSLIDARHSPSVLDVAMIDFLQQCSVPFCVIFTKLDKLNKTDRNNRLNAIANELPNGYTIRIIPFSAETGEGVLEVRSIIEQCTENNPLKNNSTVDFPPPQGSA